MIFPENFNAPGCPGITPRWTSSAKDGIGTAYNTSCHLWFTLSHGIVNEIYYPHVDTPNTRDIQFLITDGESFCHEERRDLDCAITYPEENALLYRLTNSDREGRYRIVKEIIGDPHSSVLLIKTQVEILRPEFVGKLRLYLLLAPHLGGTGQHNSAQWHDTGGRKLFHAQKEDVHLVCGSVPDFRKRSVGYVGVSDGWQDLMQHKKMEWEYPQALDGNLALTGEVDLSKGLDFTVAIAFGRNAQSASAQLLQSLAIPFGQHRERYVDQWARTRSGIELKGPTNDNGSMIRLSQCILLAHEDKTFLGAFVASLSIPWGEIKDDSDRGGYHLVWTRDMVQSATALLACGRTDSPLRALIWLASIQGSDGSFPQNSYITGQAFWMGIQLDEVAVPIILAWRLKQADALREFDPWTLVSKATTYLILHGPVTAQERWEENSGYSPSTLATIISALICAADLAAQCGEGNTADFLRDYADWLSSNLERWTVTDQGDLVPGTPRHYIRINPRNPQQANDIVSPNSAYIEIANGGGRHLARNIVSGDFLQLVRLGVRAATDPIVVDSIKVIDQVLKHDLPQGPCWRRYNHDGYGQKADGSAYDGTGVGRSWPILAGERGHYELAAGKDPRPFIESLHNFANSGGMLPEQLWDVGDLPNGQMKLGAPTGSAMPLCWAHAEYISLVRSARDGVCFDRIEPVFQRYVNNPPRNKHEVWTFIHPINKIPHGQILRLIIQSEATVVWSANGWSSKNETSSEHLAVLDLWFVDLATESYNDGTLIEFTFFWNKTHNWEGRNFTLKIESPFSPNK